MHRVVVGPALMQTYINDALIRWIIGAVSLPIYL